MKALTAADCLWSRLQRVRDEEQPMPVAPGTVFAVFAADHFCGLANPADVVSHPSWSFAEMVEHRLLRGVSPNATPAVCLALMQENALNALAVIDSAGHFRGVVTGDSLLRALLGQERALLRQARQDRRQARDAREQLAHWPRRMGELQAASRDLLDVLGQNLLERDLLQVAIEALARMLHARYGAIGLFDSDARMGEFITVGIGKHESAHIGAPPRGCGLLGLVIQQDSAIRLEDLAAHPACAGFPPHHPPMKSLLAVPVCRGARSYGRIYLCDKQHGETFSAEDELLVLSFAHSLSLILDNAHEAKALRQAHASLDHLAHYDTLTALPNRLTAKEQLKLALNRAQCTHGRVAALFVDLDNFKQTNDSFGNSVGDQLLRSVAARLLSCVRDGDTVARLSGDEFLIVLHDVAAVQDAGVIAQAILASLAASCQLGSNELFISASIGISLYPDDASDMDEMLRFANTAMFHAKQDGRNTWRFFAGSMHVNLRRQAQLEQALRHAIERKELALHYQPQVNLQSGAIVGIEALLRWNSADLGQVSPAEFIPVAEDAGLIAAIGEWVLATACKQGKRWADMGFTGLRVAVNVSARQFRQKAFLASVRQILQDSGLPYGMLELELTESLMMEEMDEVIVILNHLSSLGVGISIDDFGTGYSSLSRLKKFPISMLKIDQSFMRDVTTNADDAAIAHAIIAMGHSLRLRVIAEGVESRDHLDFLQQHGCDEVQGYLFSRPVAAEDFTALLHEGRRLQQRADLFSELQA